MTQAPYDEVKARIAALKAQGRPVADLDAAVTAGGWTPEAFKAQAKATPAASPQAEPVPFDKLFAHVEALKGQGRPVAELDAAVEASGMTPDAYKARVAQVRANAANPVYATLTGVADAATFGLADELGGAVDAMLGRGDRQEMTAQRRAEHIAAGKLHPWLQGLGELGGGLATGALLPGAGATTLAGAAGKAALGGAAQGAAHGFGSGQDLRDRLTQAATEGGLGGVLGGGVGVLAHALSPALSRITGRGGIQVADATGNLTPRASSAASAAGLDPNAVPTAQVGEAARELAGRRSTPGDVAAMLRQKISERAGVPLAAPQAAQDLDALGRMQGMMAGVKGPGAQGVVAAKNQLQNQQLAQATLDIAHPHGSQAVLGLGESDIGHRVAGAVHDVAETARRSVTETYARAGADRVVLSARDTADLVPAIMGTLRRSIWRNVLPERAPTFRAALDLVEGNIAGQSPTLAHVDEVRKAIGDMARSPSIDTRDRAMTRDLVRSLDDWIDDKVAAQVGTAGPETVQALKEARDLARQTKATFGRNPLNRNDAVGPLMEKIVAGGAPDSQGGLSGQALFDKLVGSGGKVDERAGPLLDRLREVLPPPVWDDVHAGLVKRIVGGDATKQAATPLPHQQHWGAVESRLNDALEGRGAALVGRHLGTDTLERLQALRTTAQALKVTAATGNPSGSAWQGIKNMPKAFGPALAGMLGGYHLGGGTEMVLGGLAGRGGQEVLDRMAKEWAGAVTAPRMTRPFLPPRTANLRPLSPLAALADSPGLAGWLAATRAPAAEDQYRRRDGLRGLEDWLLGEKR